MESTQAQRREDMLLMERVVARDQAAFAELFDAHSSVVLGMLVKMLRRRDTAEEILQDTFLRAWQKADSFDARRASLRGWLILMARSRAIDSLRASQARTAREEKKAKEDEVLMARREAGAEESLLGHERERRLVRAMNTLPEEQRTCIQMAFFDGLTHSQLAERLEQPLGTIKSRIALGMRKLRQALR